MFNIAHDDPPVQGPAKKHVTRFGDGVLGEVLPVLEKQVILKCDRNNLYVPALRKRGRPVV